MTATESYVSLYSSLAEAAPMQMLCLLILGAMRLAPIIAFAPFLGAKTPGSVKMGLLLSMVVVFLPTIALTAKASVAFNLEFAALCAKELFVGLIMSFLIAVPFYVAQSSGALIDFLRGSSSLQVTDPMTQTQASDLGLIYNFVLVVIFYQIGGPFLFYSGFLDSYQFLPADGWIPASFFAMHHPIWETLLTALHKIMAISIQLGAPSILAILMTETFLGIANRLAPQVQIVFLGMSLKSLVGLGILALAWFFILKQLHKQLVIWIEKFTSIIHFFAT